MECSRNSSFTDDVLDLYMSSFDEREKVPIENIERTFGHGGELITYHDDDRFVGFTFHFSQDDRIFFVYFATRPELRSKGYGSEMIRMFREMFSDRRIFFPVEALDEKASDIEIRRRRHAFYLRNGCVRSGYTVISDDYPFDLFYMNGSVTKDEAVETIGLYESVHNGE